MSAKRGLGRGFDTLIPTDLLDESFDPTASQDHQVSELRSIRLSEITPDPDQPRRVFEAESLAELSESIREHGVLQPIIVTSGERGYMIVAGERRYRAAVEAGLDKIPALVRTLTAQHKLELSLIENLQRRDLSAIETATAYAKLRDQFNLSVDEVAKRVGRSPSAVSNTIRLLQLPKVAQVAIAEGNLTEGQARPLIKLSPELVEQLVPKIIVGQWNARRIEQVAATLKAEAKPDRAKTGPVKHYASETGKIAERLSASVDIKMTRKGKGSLVIGFNSDEELKRILGELQK